MFNRNTILAIAVIVMIPVAVILAPIPQAKAQFVMASWDYPDEYGQGVYGFFVLDNSSGSFMPWSGPIILPDNASIFEAEAGISLGLEMRITVNYTFLGLEDPDPYNHSAELHPALNYVRLNVTVTALAEVVFSQDNFTYNLEAGDMGDGVWYYGQEVFFDFLTVSGTVYIVTVTYEVYYVDE